MKLQMLIASSLALMVEVLPQGDAANLEIINGNKTISSSLAFIEVYTKYSGWFCGGAVISKNYVLTTAECVSGDSVKVDITLGAFNISDLVSFNKTNSTSFIIHEKFHTEGWPFNIALINVNTSALNQTFNIVTLPKRSDSDNKYLDAQARLSGWGISSVDGTEISNTSMSINTTVIANEECEEMLGKLTDSQLCTSAHNVTGPCFGDDGGPLVDDDGVLIGVFTLLNNKCPIEQPAAYIKVAAFLDWIEENSDAVIS